MKILNWLCLVGFAMLITPTLAQDTNEQDLFELSLEDLMNIPIKSASKKSETLFDAPLSSYTITKAEIEKSGAPTIMEALRLAPGIIVREQANGMYDIHIRGMENLTRTNGTFLKANAYTLVMIDNRPVFNHGLGGTYWESLPIDINDVERIEIVRGPSSPLFGPNAVTGVINIITKRMEDSSTLVTTNVQGGTLGTVAANASVGKKIGDKFSVIVSGNFQNRDRVDSDYYNPATGMYGPSNNPGRYNDPSRALNKWGVNGYLTYEASENINFDLSVTTQAAEFQKIWIDNPLQEGKTDNTSVNFNASIHDLDIRTSYVKGHNLDLKASAPYAEYDFSVADFVAEYNIHVSEKYKITPGFSYQTTTFDDRDYVNPNEGRIGLFNAENSINTIAGYLRADLAFTDKWRVLAGLRLDKFSDPDDAYLAYELASTYKINNNNLVRAAYTKSNSGSFIGYNFVNVGGMQNGNTNLDLFTLTMVEVGYRVQVSRKLQLDVDMFRQHGENLTAILQVDGGGTRQFQNVPTTATQVGATVSVNYVPNQKLQLKPFFTFQKTETKDMPSIYLDPTLPSPPFPAVTYSNSTHAYTPGSYGGFYFNYQPVTKLNVNVSGYYFTKQTQYDQSYDAADKSTLQYAAGQIDGKFMFNAKVSYEVVKGLNVFVNARNLMGADSREFYAGDRASGLYMGGLSYNLKQ
ncbi:MAG: TonB-dependent receptor [Cyclobacteriaceae bacterium]|nr:TonB-dependent receptor [Cyclobacteriaceae bacterium]